MALTQKAELQLLRNYFRASEYRRLIGAGEAMKGEEYSVKTGEMNAQFYNLKRFSEKLQEKTNLLEFIKHQ